VTKWTTQQEEYWNSVSSDYDRLYQNRWSELENAEVLAQLKSLPLQKKQIRVLDIGCGTGLGLEICNNFLEEPIEYVGIDISPEMIRLCEKKFPQHTFIVQDMKDLENFPTDHFDLLICLFTSFSFTEEPQKTLTEISRVIAPAGQVFLSVLSKYSLRRLVRFKFRKVEPYSTRYSSDLGTIPANTYTSREMFRLANQSGLSVRKIDGLGLFSGVLEFPALWPIDKLLSTTVPDLCHIINLNLVKGGKNGVRTNLSRI
jgi:ubiquinone/menaquinone biosynthesis C-methylase UbiE